MITTTCHRFCYPCIDLVLSFHWRYSGIASKRIGKFAPKALGEIASKVISGYSEVGETASRGLWET
jgi:hypothetical protein